MRIFAHTYRFGRIILARLLRIPAAAIGMRVFIGILAYMAAANLFVVSQKSHIEALFSRYCGGNYRIAKAWYSFPHTIVVERVNAHSMRYADSGMTITSARAVRMNFSWYHLVVKHRFVVGRIDIMSPHIMAYSRSHVKSLHGLISFSRLPAALTLGIYDAVVHIRTKAGFAAWLVDAVVELRQDHFVSVSGRAYQDTVTGGSIYRSAPPQQEYVNFSAYGYAHTSGFTIENVELQKGGMYAKLWGTFINSRLQCNGVAFFGGSAAEVPVPQKFAHGHFYKRQPPVSVPFNSSASSFTGVYDMAGNFLIEENRVTCETFTATIGRVPVLVTGFFDTTAGTRIQCRIMSRPALSAHKGRAWDANITLTRNHSSWNAEANIAFSDSARALGVNRIGACLQGIQYRINPGYKINAWFSGAQITSEKGGAVNEVRIDTTTLYADIAAQKIKGYSRLYDGYMQWANGAYMPQVPHVFLRCMLWNVDAGLCAKGVPFFPFASGRMSAEIIIKKNTAYECAARMWVRDGQLRPGRVCGKLSSFFGIPQLQDVRFKEAQAGVSVAGGVSRLQGLRLEAEDIRVYADGMIDSGGLINATVGVSLAKRLLRASEKLSLLAGLIDRDDLFVDFVFLLSGPWKNPNYAWQESVFKQRLQRMLPSLFERALERRVEEAMRRIQP